MYINMHSITSRTNVDVDKALKTLTEHDTPGITVASSSSPHVTKSTTEVMAEV